MAITKEAAPKAAVEVPALVTSTPETVDNSPHGWEEVGTPDIDAWWSPEENAVITGQIIGRMKLEKDGAKRDVLIIKTTEKCLGKAPGSKTATIFLAGSIIGVGVRHKLRGLLLYVKHKGMVWIKALNTTKLKGSQTMWNFEVKAKGKKAQPEPINVNVDRIDGDDDDDDVTPF